jgi:hypothetical protein
MKVERKAARTAVTWVAEMVALKDEKRALVLVELKDLMDSKWGELRVALMAALKA